MALMSMWLAKCGASSARVPVRMLTTPPGRSLVARISAKVMAGERRGLAGEDDGGVAAEDGRRDERDEAEQGGGIRADDDDDAGRLGGGEIEVRRGDRIHGAEELREFVRPAGVVDEAVDAGGHFARGIGARRRG